MEHEAYEDGYLVKQSASEGDTVPIGEVIGILADSPDAVPEDSGGSAPSEDKDEEKTEEKAEEQPEAKPEEKAQEPAPAQEEPAPAADGPRPRTSPLAR